MKDDFVPRIASRARWMTELSTALDEAQRLLSQLVAERMGQADVDSLRSRVEQLRVELGSLHRRGFAAGEVVKRRAAPQPDWRKPQDGAS